MKIKERFEIKSCALNWRPFTMGLFKSAIYFPFAVLNQLNMQEMEAIIAHELAHIKKE